MRMRLSYLADPAAMAPLAEIDASSELSGRGLPRPEFALA